jgi:hypothetical protein
VVTNGWGEREKERDRRDRERLGDTILLELIMKP